MFGRLRGGMVKRVAFSALLWAAGVLAVGLPAAPADASHTSHHVRANGWSLTWDVTATDGLAIENASFNGTLVLQRVSVPQCLVRYYKGTPTMKDQLGTSGNIRYVRGSATITRASSYVALSARFECCGYPNAGSYRYKVRTVFYEGGDWRPTVYVYGPGLESRARYECHIRIDLDLGGGGRDFFEYYDRGWKRPRTESRHEVTGSTDDHGNQWRNFDGARWGYGIDPRASDGAAAMYVLRSHAGEGGGDLSSYTLPSKFNGTEAVQNVDNVDWYWPRTEYRRPSGCPGSGCSKNPTLVGPYLTRHRRIIG